MKAVLFVVVLLLVTLGAVGFYRGWFNFSSENADGKSSLILTVDQDKIEKEKKAVTESFKDLGGSKKDGAAGPGEKRMDGTMVSFKGGELRMKDKEGKEHGHTLATDVRVSCDAKPCKIEDLKVGMRIRVTTASETSDEATRIEAIDKNEAFERVG